MEELLKKLEVKDIATVEITNKTEPVSHIEFEQAKAKLSNLKDEAAETSECLASINTRIQEHLLKMEKIKKLDF